MDKTKPELKLGIFVFVGLVILTTFVLNIGKLSTYYAGYPIKIIFGFVNGVKPGSPVRFAGVNVGEVKEVELFPYARSNRVEVTAWIEKSLKIPADSKVLVGTLGLLGEKYIEIIPPAKHSPFLNPGDTLIGSDPLLVQDWVDGAQKILKDLQGVIEKMNAGEGTIGKLLNDDKLYQELEALISDIRGTKEGTIGKLLYEDKLYQELEALVNDLRRHPWKLFWKTKEKPEKK